MNGLTTIASLPGSGTGCAAALRAEVGEQPKPASAHPFDAIMKDIAKTVIRGMVKDFMQTPEALAIVEKFKGDPAVQGTVLAPTCRATFRDICSFQGDKLLMAADVGQGWDTRVTRDHSNVVRYYLNGQLVREVVE